MNYQITIMTLQDRKEAPRKVLVVTSETPLTVKDVKDKCLTEVAVDATKYTVKSQELKSDSSWKSKEALADDVILDEKKRILDYYITLEAKA